MAIYSIQKTIDGIGIFKSSLLVTDLTNNPSILNSKSVDSFSRMADIQGISNAKQTDLFANGFACIPAYLLQKNTILVLPFYNQLQHNLGLFPNYHSTFNRFFGPNAYQDSSKLYINKNDLPRLTPKTNNTAESLFIALLLRMILFESNYFLSNIFVAIFNVGFVTENEKTMIKHVLIIYVFTLIKYQATFLPGSNKIPTNADVSFSPKDF